FAYFNQIPDEKGFAWNYGNEDPVVKAPLAEQSERLAGIDRRIAEAEQRADRLQPQLRADQREWERALASRPDPHLQQSAPHQPQSGNTQPTPAGPQLNSADWTVTEGLVFRSDKDPLKGAGCEENAPCEWAAAGGAQHFDGKHYLETDGKIADFNYLDP